MDEHDELARSEKNRRWRAFVATASEGERIEVNGSKKA